MRVAGSILLVLGALLGVGAWTAATEARSPYVLIGIFVVPLTCWMLGILLFVGANARPPARQKIAVFVSMSIGICCLLVAIMLAFKLAGSPYRANRNGSGGDIDPTVPPVKRSLERF